MSSPFSESDLAVVRRAYARQMLALAAVGPCSTVEAAFAAIPREDFLGPPPWHLLTSLEGSTPTDEPVLLYQDAGVVLDRDRGVNNGSPSLHARWLHALAPQMGESVVHVGAGAGYYSAILAHLVGPDGQVAAIESDERLAALARGNLAAYANVTVIQGNGTMQPDAPTDCIYVNFGVERPMPAWIGGLRDGGRLVFPLGYRDGHRIAGGGFRITRDPDGFEASYLGPAYFIGAESVAAANDIDRARLKAAFKSGTAGDVTRLVWRPAEPRPDCWFAADDWALCHEP